MGGAGSGGPAWAGEGPGRLGHVRRGAAQHGHFLQSATRKKHRRAIEQRLARRLEGVRTPFVPMNGVLAKLLPRLFEPLLALNPVSDSNLSTAPETDCQKPFGSTTARAGFKVQKLLTKPSASVNTPLQIWPT